MSTETKHLFANPSHERALLGFCFKAISNYYDVASVIDSDDILRTDHKLIFMLLKTLEKRGVANFDSDLVIQEAQKNGVLDDVGGYEYIHALADFIVSGENIQFYIDKVLDGSARYQLHKTINESIINVESKASSDDVTAVELIDGVESAVLNVSMKAKAVKEATNLSDGIDEYIEDRQNNPVDVCGVMTGFPIFDKQVDGLTPGSLTVVAARPKNGKSTLLTTISSNVAFGAGSPVLYVDTEMRFDEFRSRIISILSGIPERLVKHGGYTEQQRHNIDQAVKIIKRGRLFHEYCPGYSVDKLKSLYRKYKHREDIGLAVFDYIKAPEGADFSNKKEYQVLGDVTTSLKDMAGILDIPFLVATQVNRQQDVADSDRILRYADVLTFLKAKTSDEIVAEGGPDAGTFRWVISDSRRGGSTPMEGIGMSFVKRSLQLFEAKQQFIDFQDLDYTEKKETSITFGGDDGDTEKATEEEYFG